MNKTFLQIKQSWLANMYAHAVQKAAAATTIISKCHWLDRAAYYEERYLLTCDQLAAL